MKNKIITIILVAILIASIIFTIYSRLNQKDLLHEGNKINHNIQEENTISKEDILEEIKNNNPSIEDIAGIIDENNKKEESNLNFIEILDDDIKSTKSKIIGKNENVEYEIIDNIIYISKGKFDNYEFSINKVDFDFETYTLIVTLDMYALDFNTELIIKNTNFNLFYFDEKLETIQKERKYNITSDVSCIELKYKLNENLNFNEIRTDGFSLNYKDELNTKTINIY